MEEWAPVRGFEDRYEVSNMGRVRSKSYLKSGRNRNGPFTYWTSPRLMQQTYNHDGYLMIDQRKDGERRTGLVHRLVAEAFIPNPENKPQVNHKNSVRDDNVLSNLEWATDLENVQHGFREGFRSNVGEKHPLAILREEDIPVIRKLRSEKIPVKEIAAKFGVRPATIYKVLAKKGWTHT